ncbi:hypothetical protein LCGC14_2467590 [marine sediment metagenome]|uniref:Uncharacterized protein n=1 Tax=marine sediment metagenome TaxID=412755 RepID=A0A0F9BC21_9ZZZZ
MSECKHPRVYYRDLLTGAPLERRCQDCNELLPSLLTLRALVEQYEKVLKIYLILRLLEDPSVSFSDKAQALESIGDFHGSWESEEFLLDRYRGLVDFLARAALAEGKRQTDDPK